MQLNVRLLVAATLLSVPQIYSTADVVRFIEETVRCDSEVTFRGVRRELETKLGYQKRRMDDAKADIDFLIQLVLRVSGFQIRALSICSSI